MRENEKLVTVQEFENTFDAELGKIALDSAGVESVIVGDNLVTTMVYGVPSITVELQVRQSDVEKAKQILAEKNEVSDEDVESDQ